MIFIAWKRFNFTDSFRISSKTQYGKGLIAMNVLLKTMNSCELTLQTQCQVFDTFVTSTMHYGCEEWINMKR